MKKFDPKETSVVICCAGVGTRLGIDTTKALVDVCGDSTHVYDILNERLPLPALFLRTREIDTPDDYDHMIEWFEDGMEQIGPVAK